MEIVNLLFQLVNLLTETVNLLRVANLPVSEFTPVLFPILITKLCDMVEKVLGCDISETISARCKCMWWEVSSAPAPSCVPSLRISVGMMSESEKPSEPAKVFGSPR